MLYCTVHSSTENILNWQTILLQNSIVSMSPQSATQYTQGGREAKDTTRKLEQLILSIF